MRNFFSPTATVDDLPSWEADDRVTAARRHAHTLQDRQDALRQQAAALRHSGDGSLVTIPSPSHPSWPVQREYEEAHRQWKVAERELAEIEATVKADAAQAGYDAGYQVWQDEVVPAIEQLIASLQQLQITRERVYARTAVRIGELGTVSLEPKALKEFVAQVEQRGTFGTRG
jgi:hypothetical protein